MMRKMTIFRVTGGVGILNLIDSGGNHGNTLALLLRSGRLAFWRAIFLGIPCADSHGLEMPCRTDHIKSCP